MSDDILKFPLKPRDNDIDRVLKVAHSYKCSHKRYVIDPQLAQVECADCKEKLDPMFALIALSQQETRFHELHERYQDELKRLNERLRTKCEHCNKVTRISRS